MTKSLIQSVLDKLGCDQMTALIVFAFPAMGKTPLAQNTPGYVDLDFGHFRDALICTKVNQDAIMPYYARLVRRYLADGYSVLVNDPMLLNHLSAQEYKRCVMFLPCNLSYAANKLHYTDAQVREAVTQWHFQARSKRIPVTYLPQGLDVALADTVPAEPRKYVKVKPRKYEKVKQGLSPTASHCASVEKAAWNLGCALRDASPGLRSYPADTED